MANVNDITSQDWSFSLTVDEIVQGFADIQQCIYIILVTKKGTDPTRPDFGCGVYDYIDRPVNVAVPNMKKEIAVAIATYEPRVKIIRILHRVEVSHLTFSIEWTLAGSTQEETQTTFVNYG